MAIGASLGSAGTAPVPNAGACGIKSFHICSVITSYYWSAIIMLITVWETALPGTSVPDAIAYVQAIAFLVSRFQTTVNVASDLFIVRMIQTSLDADRKRSSHGNNRAALS